MLMFAPLKMQAQMAELVDASDSKSGIGNNVQVRFLFWARIHLNSSKTLAGRGFFVSISFKRTSLFIEIVDC